MKAKVVKLEPYPEINPIGIAVGFNLIFDNGRTSYIDTIVDLSLHGDEIISEAWEGLTEEVETRQNSIGKLPSALGSIWSPSTGIIDQDEEDTLEDYDTEE